MKKEDMLRHLKAFDPAIFTLLQDEIQHQRCTLSLIVCLVVIPLVWPF